MRGALSVYRRAGIARPAREKKRLVSASFSELKRAWVGLLCTMPHTHLTPHAARKASFSVVATSLQHARKLVSGVALNFGFPHGSA